MRLLSRLALPVPRCEVLFQGFRLRCCGVRRRFGVVFRFGFCFSGLSGVEAVGRGRSVTLCRIHRASRLLEVGLESFGWIFLFVSQTECVLVGDVFVCQVQARGLY